MDSAGRGKKRDEEGGTGRKEGWGRRRDGKNGWDEEEEEGR